MCSHGTFGAADTDGPAVKTVKGPYTFASVTNREVRHALVDQGGLAGQICGTWHIWG